MTESTIKRKFNLSNVRISYPNLFKFGKVFDETKDPTYNCVIMLDKVKDAAAIKELITSRNALLAEMGVKNVEQYLENPHTINHTMLRDGDVRRNKEGELTAEYANHITFVAKSYSRVAILNRDAKTPIVEEDGLIYGGCYVNAVIYLKSYANDKGKGIKAELVGIQYVSAGEPLGNKVSLEGEFMPLEPFEDDSFNAVI